MNSADEVFATWRAAETPTVEVERLPWEELERVLKAAAPVREAAETLTFADEVLRKVHRMRRLLTSAPILPGDQLIGIAGLGVAIDRFVAEHPNHGLRESLVALATALGELAVADSPLARWCADALCEYGEADDGRPEALVVVPRTELMAPIQAWLTAEELDCVALATPRDLRLQAPRHRIAFLFGHPGRVYSSPWKDPEETVREHGWLFTAPPASRIRVAMTADAPRLEASALSLLTTGNTPTVTVHDPGPQRSSPILREWSPPTGHETTVQPPRCSGADFENSPATELFTASGHRLYFHSTIGPRPTAIEVDDSRQVADLCTSSLSAIHRGTLLVARIGDAPYEQVVARGVAWLQAKRDWSRARITEARSSANEMKSALRKALQDNGFGTLHRKLVDRGLDTDYARTLLRSPLHPHYIAPSRREAFEALVGAIGADRLTPRFDDLVGLRTAHRQAGEQIRQDMLAMLAGATWIDQVEECGWASVEAPDLGMLLLTLVTGRSSTSVQIAQHLLGVPIDDRGRPVTSPGLVRAAAIADSVAP